MCRLRVLVLGDSHLGSTFPRGVDVSAAFRRALEPARRGDVDLVLHGGDLFDKPRVSERVLWQAMEPLFEVAQHHAPVVLVPGNHERGLIDVPPLLKPPDLHVLDHPRTVRLDRHGLSVAVGGFPFHRRAREALGDLVGATELLDTEADVRLLLIHQAVEGAQVGPHDFTFRTGAEVVRAASVPPRVAAVLAGHVHRHQVLETGLDGQVLRAPVVVPGSTVPTSFQERLETKGTVRLDLEGTSDGGRVRVLRQVPLPTRPMHVLEVEAEDLEPARLERRLLALPRNALVQLRVPERLDVAGHPLLRREALRGVARADQEIHVPWRRVS